MIFVLYLNKRTHKTVHKLDLFETFWSILEQLIYAGGWEAKSIDQLKKRVTKKLNEVDIKVVQTMFSGIRKQLR